MHHRPFGRTGLVVPAVGMGTWRSFDVRAPADVARCGQIVDVALERGASLFDSSPMYGEAERVLAQSLDGRRERAVVATKVWTPSRKEGRRQIERALAWYGGRVDVYQIHNLVAWREHLPVLDALREQGKVGVVGATHYSHAAMPELMRLMETGRIAQIQIPYNAADRAVERDVLPLAESSGIGVLVMEPLGSGSLVRRPPSANALRPLERFGVRSWAQALLKWILADPRVHCAIPATRRPERLRENAEAGDEPWLDAEAREYVAHLARAMV
jgi:aryl-alcohol dehydrogenase-like predicted oxidoreductase